MNTEEAFGRIIKLINGIDELNNKVGANDVVSNIKAKYGTDPKVLRSITHEQIMSCIYVQSDNGVNGWKTSLADSMSLAKEIERILWKIKTA